MALYGHYEPRMPEGVWGSVVRLAAIVLLVIACGGLAVVSWMFLNGVLCGHFYGRLAAQVEMQLGLAASDLRDLSLTYQAVDVVRDVSAGDHQRSVLAVKFGAGDRIDDAAVCRVLLRQPDLWNRVSRLPAGGAAGVARINGPSPSGIAGIQSGWGLPCCCVTSCRSWDP